MYDSLLLVIPPQHALLEGFSSGLISLANYVAAHEPALDVRLLDLSHTAPEDLERELALAFDGGGGRVLVGITTTTATYQWGLAVARSTRRLPVDASIVMGGHHASPEARVVLREHPEIDCIIGGEGEEALLSLVRNPDDWSAVPSLTYRAGPDGSAGDGIRANPRAKLLSTAELDEIDPTHRTAASRSSTGKFDHTSYVSARGCPLKCAFCAVAGEQIRAKSIPRVIDDLRRLVRDFGYRRIAIEDNFFAHSPARTRDLCAAIEACRREPGMDFTWDAQTRVESLQSAETVAAMRRAGCDALYVGVESLVDAQLRQMRKTPDPERYLDLLCRRTVPLLATHDIECYINLQLGLPGETDGQRETTIEMLLKLGAIAGRYRKSITVFPQLAVVYPGTADYLAARGVGGRLAYFDDMTFERFTAWEIEQQPVLTWLGRHFAHGTGGIPLGILSPESLGAGRFDVDPDAVLRVVNQLDRMRQVRGVRVFNYAKYLVTADPAGSSTPTNVSPSAGAVACAH